MQKGGEGVQIACKNAYVINGRPQTMVTWGTGYSVVTMVTWGKGYSVVTIVTWGKGYSVVTMGYGVLCGNYGHMG